MHPISYLNVLIANNFLQYFLLPWIKITLIHIIKSAEIVTICKKSVLNNLVYLMVF